MLEKIMVHEFEDAVYTMDGFGRVRTWTVTDEGGFEEVTGE